MPSIRDGADHNFCFHGPMQWRLHKCLHSSSVTIGWPILWLCLDLTEFLELLTLTFTTRTVMGKSRWESGDTEGDFVKPKSLNLSKMCETFDSSNAPILLQWARVMLFSADTHQYHILWDPFPPVSLNWSTLCTLSEHTLVKVAPMPNQVDDILAPTDSHKHLPALTGWRCIDALHLTSEHGMCES